MPLVKSYKVNSAASANAANIKAGPGQVFSVTVYNAHATNAVNVKLFDLLASPTVGTDRPAIVLKVAGAGGSVVQDFGPLGVRFDNGIGICMVTGDADSATTAIGANDVKVTVNYK